MPTSFSAAAYVAALQKLMDQQGVEVTVQGFTPGKLPEKLKNGPIAELVIDAFPCGPSGVLRELDGTLEAGLLVVRRLDAAEAEALAFELALDVATALVDEVEPDGTPVMAAGPIIVRDIEPTDLDGALEYRAVAFLVRYEQQIRIRRTNQPSVPTVPNKIFVGRYPDVGEAHVDDYRQIVPPPEE